MTKALSLAPVPEREFGAIFARLAIQLGWRDADLASIQSYHAALGTFPRAVLERTAQHFATEHGRRFFPSTAEWHEAATEERDRQMRQSLTRGREEPWHDECEACSDTGWVCHACDGTALCGRLHTHAAHRYVTACPCRPTNRTYQRHWGERR